MCRYNSANCTNHLPLATSHFDFHGKTLFLLIALIAISVCDVKGQEKNPQRGFQPGNSYALSQLESINTTNGNLILNIPLGQLPPGRGTLSGGISLRYNSKLYDSDVAELPDDSNQLGLQNMVIPTNQGVGIGGWAYSSPVNYSLRVINRAEVEGGPYQCSLPVGPDDSRATYIWKVKVIYPDGAEREFRPYGYNDVLSDGYFNVDPNTGDVKSINGSCGLVAGTTATNPMTYFSTDGTYTRLTINRGVGWTLSFPDGSRFVSDSSGQFLYDKNGNYLKNGTVTLPNGHQVSGLLDEFGRYVAIDTDGVDNLIYSQGFNGEALIWKVRFKTIYVLKNYRTTAVSGGRMRGGSSSQTFQGETTVVDRITLPAQLGNLTYQFSYNAPDYVSPAPPPTTPSVGWGEISGITLPSGAIVNYEYEQDNAPLINNTRRILDNGVKHKKVTYLAEYDNDTSTVEDNWTYATSHSSCTIVGPDGGTTTHSFNDVTVASSGAGQVYKDVYPDGTVVERLWVPNSPSTTTGFPAGTQGANFFVKTEFRSITNNSGQLVKTAIKDFEYDKNGNVTSQTEYDWVPYGDVPRDSGKPTGLPANLPAPLRKTLTSFYNAPPPAANITDESSVAYWHKDAPTFRTAVKSTEIRNGSNQALARSEITYDNENTTGNVTQQLTWDSSKGGYTAPLTSSNSISTSNVYASWASGATGKLISTTDAMGTLTVFTYGIVGPTSDLYPTQVKSAYDTSVQRIESRTYDYTSGLVTTTTDVDNQIVTKTTYDAIGRPTLIQEAFDTDEERRTATLYFDSERRVVTRADLTAKGDGKLVSIQHYDQLGRVRLSRQLEDSSIYQAEISEAVGIKVQTRYINTNGNSYVLQSNPYRAANSAAAAAETSMGWTRTKADIGGRPMEVQTFAGATLPSPWGANSVSTGTVTTSYDGYLTVVSDQLQKLRRSKVDALGRLVRVDEPVSVNGTDQLGDDANPLQPTSYSYDALGNLRTVSQGNQTRTFDYSSLSRLISAQNPESGFISYKYDANGNLKVKTDARLVSAHYKYDQLNRVIKRWYNSTSSIEESPSNENLPSGVGVSPQANFTYDAHPATSPFFGFQSQDKSKGRLTAVTYGSNTTTGDYFRYDIFGRNFSKTQRIGANDYKTTAQYNRANAVTQLTYPSLHTVTNSFDTAGRLYSMSGTLGDNTNRTYSTGILYSSGNDLVKEQFGNQIYNKLFYNSRGQLSEIRESTSYTGPSDVTADRGAIVNHYSEQCPGMCAPDVNGPQAMTDNNGNLKKQQILIPGSNTRLQQYAYDELNRLKSVRETIGNTEQWRQWFSYDRYGNRTIDNSQDQGAPRTYGTGINNKAFTANVNNDNRLGVPNGQGGVMHYDAAGNLDNDTYTGAGARIYDGENKITSAWGGVAPGQAEIYTYDATGQRIKRNVDGVETWIVYGLGGDMVAEYLANAEAANPNKEYGYRNGQLLITAESGSGLAAPVFADNFDDNSLDSSRWTQYYPGMAPTITEQSQQLQISPTPNTAAYNGVYSNLTYDLTNRMVQVESVQALSQAGWCENFLEVELDANNYLMIQVGAGNMIFRSRVSGVNDQTSIPYDATANRFWRIRHNQAANQIYFETSANDSVWVTRKTVNAGFSLTALRFHLLGGAYGTGNSSPGIAKYDTFKLVASTAGPVTLTVPNSGFEPPVIGNTLWQFAPTGGSWTFENGGGITGMNSAFTGAPSSAPQGVQVAFIQGTGSAYQTVSGFQAGTNYIITVSAIQRTNCCNAGGQDIGVFIDNTQVGSFHPNSTAYSDYSTAAFTTSSGSHTIKFLGLNPLGGDHTAFIDNVRITGSAAPGFSVQWLVSDQLGTPRIIFDESGELANVKRHDYLPFGEEIAVAVGGRTVNEGYSKSDGVRQQFTSKERDVETGLDYFLARYYSSIQGRFTSPDEFKGGPEELFEEVDPHDPLFYADIAEPQSLNKYHYALNSPLKYVDPDGHQATLTDKLKAGASAVGKTVMNTFEGAVSAWAEDNGVGGTTGPQNTVGRIIGHTAALGQGFGEAYVGVQGMAAGATEAILTAPACASGAGCAVPVAGVATAAAAGVVTTHGTLVIANTLNNIFSKKTTLKPKEGSQGGPGAGKDFPETTKNAERAASNNSCRFCKTETTRSAKPSPTRSNIDHAIPKSRGGNNTAANAQNTCQTCNLKKGTKTTKEFLNQ